MPKPKTITIGGIKFQLAEVEWEDAYKANKAPAAKLFGKLVGPEVVSWGYTAKIGKYRVIVHEYNPIAETVDVTVIPLTPRVRVRPK